MEAKAIDFYQSLFTAQDGTDPKLVTEWVYTKIDDVMNNKMCAPITNYEIEQTLFMMPPDRSPVPNGFIVGCYIRHWNIPKDFVCLVVRNFLEGRQMPENVNSTLLVLIPKVKKSTRSLTISAHLIM